MGLDPAEVQHDPAEARHDPAEAERNGLYGPSSQAWRLSRESILLLGAGPRALLMQIAHPLVAEGVDQHSDFRTDPWRRLRSTLRSYLAIVYGTTVEGRAEIQRLNRFHEAVAGPVCDAEAIEATGATVYAARDPALALWVHATLIDATLVAYEAWLAPLTPGERARFYEETRPIGLAFGIPADLLPIDIAAFDAYLAAMLGPAGPVRVTPTARQLARAILAPPLAPLAALAPEIAGLEGLLGTIPPGAYGWTFWPALSLLPPAVRDAYGVPWGIRERAVSGWLVASWRAWRPLLPRTWRQMPQALAADRRVGGVGALARGRPRSAQRLRGRPR